MEIKKAGDDLLSHAKMRSIIGKRGLDFRVRDGDGYFPSFYNHQQKCFEGVMSSDRADVCVCGGDKG